MQQQINFYSAEFRPRYQIFTVSAFLRVMAVTAMAMFATYVYGTQSLTAIANERAAVLQQEQVSNARLEKMRPIIEAMGSKKSWADLEQEKLQLLKEKELVLEFVQGTQLGDTLGFSRHLRSLARLHLDGIWLNHIRLSALGDSTRLEGTALRADLVPAYLQFLAAEPPFAAQRFRRFQIDQLVDGREDEVTFSVTSDDQPVAKTASPR